METAVLLLVLLLLFVVSILIPKVPLPAWQSPGSLIRPFLPSPGAWMAACIFNLGYRANILSQTIPNVTRTVMDIHLAIYARHGVGEKTEGWPL